jgi:hypothetical protein
MPKAKQQWLLYRCVKGELTPLSKPYKTKRQAEKGREKYPEKERKGIGVGIIRQNG